MLVYNCCYILKQRCSKEMGPLVLHKIASAVDADDGCINLLCHACFLGDDVLVGSKAAVLRALSLIEELGAT